MTAGDLTDRSTVRRLLSEAGIHPSKRLGQNFLVDRTVVETVRRIASDAKPCRIVEIGAGLGTITRALASVAPRVTAIELDQRLVEILERTTADFEAVQIHHGDVLDFSFQRHEDTPKAFVVASLPYASTAAILQHLVAHRAAITEAVLLTQREVAEKIKASPGAQGSGLGVLVRGYADVERVRRVGRESFYPVPRVDSVLWIARFRDRPRFTSDPDTFFAVARTIYGMRRKMLRVALRSIAPREEIGRILARSGIDGQGRGETLSFAQLDRLAQAVQDPQAPLTSFDS